MNLVIAVEDEVLYDDIELAAVAEHEARLIQKLRRLNAIAEGRGQSLAQMALAWNLKDDLVPSVIIGASSTAQLDDNLNAIRNTVFSKEELDMINETIG